MPASKWSNAVMTATKIAAVVALIAGLSSAAMGQTVNSSPAAGSGMKMALSDISAQRAPVRQTRNVALTNYNGQGARVINTAVGRDNYQNWRQACCF